MVTYGRSGSTLLQGLLSSIPGYRIRGENGAAVYELFKAHRTLVHWQAKFADKGRLTPTSSWYGIEEFPVELSLQRLREYVVATILRPGPEDRVVGFKEVRWYQSDVEDFVSFLQEAFPGARFVLNTRNLDDVAASNWWRKKPDARATLERLDARLRALCVSLGPAAFHVHYDDYVGEPEVLRSLFDWLGEEFRVDRVREVLATKHSF